MNSTEVYRGNCHCRAVQFEFDAKDKLTCTECNCSICSMTGYLHIIVAKDHFRLLSGAESLTTYSWNTGVAQHLFCKHCGIKSFYIPRSHPDSYSVNLRCLVPQPPLEIKQFDGKNWEANINSLHSQTN